MAGFFFFFAKNGFKMPPLISDSEMIKNIKKNHNDLFFLETKRERERVVCLFYLFLIVFAKSTKESALILLFEIEFKPPPQKKKTKKKGSL